MLCNIISIGETSNTIARTTSNTMDESHKHYIKKKKEPDTQKNTIR